MLDPRETEPEPDQVEAEVNSDGRRQFRPHIVNGVNSPYADGTPSPPRSEPSRAERLASVLRATPNQRPLTTMLKWKEVRNLALGAVTGQPVGTDHQKDKAANMAAEQKALAAHRAAIEKSVEKLATRRGILRAELDEVEAELKLLLSMLKAAGGPSPHLADGPEPVLVKNGKPGKKAKATDAKLDRAVASGPSAVAINLASKGDVTPASLAKVTGQSVVLANQVLGRLLKAGTLRRVSRGVYGAA